MSTPVQTASRLLDSLEQFFIQEGILLRARDYRQAAQVRRRFAPIIRHLCSLASEPGVRDLAPRVNEVLAHRRANIAELLLRRETLSAERSRLAEARARVRRIAPYRRAGVVRPVNRLNTSV